MAKGPVLTGKVKQLIAQVYLEHRNWKTRKIREEVLRKLPIVIPWADPGWPGLSVIQKELAKIRKKDYERSLQTKELSTPWSIESLAKYPIPPESLPLVLEVFIITLKMRVLPLSIGKAMWVARLSHITQDPFLLLQLANRYSYIEWVNEIMGEDDELQEEIFGTLWLYCVTKRQIEVRWPKEASVIRGYKRTNLAEHQKILKSLHAEFDEKPIDGLELQRLLKEIHELERREKELGIDWRTIFQEVKHERSHNKEG